MTMIVAIVIPTRGCGGEMTIERCSVDAEDTWIVLWIEDIPTRYTPIRVTIVFAVLEEQDAIAYITENPYLLVMPYKAAMALVTATALGQFSGVRD
jgi:hypothetical protein